MILQTKKDIENISFDILKTSKALDVFPTPIDKIVNHAGLIVEGGIDLKSLEKKHKSFFISDFLRSGLAAVRGFLDRSEKLIYLDMSQNANRQGFVKLHETGHDVLPWQKATLAFLDDDMTLDSETQEEFEAEANYFASITLFQNDRFDNECKKYELGMPSVMQLSNHFGASKHATFRRYVETSKHRCALLILKDLSPSGQLSGTFRNAFHSDAFLSHFGSIDWPANFGYKWEFMRDHRFMSRKWKTNGSMKLHTLNGEVAFNYHFFGNSYNAFVLIFPKGENKPTRTKIILQ